MARAILQQWAKAKTEGGSVRSYTQAAQVWPLEYNPKLEGIEAAIQVLRQARDYLRPLSGGGAQGRHGEDPRDGQGGERSGGASSTN